MDLSSIFRNRSTPTPTSSLFPPSPPPYSHPQPHKIPPQTLSRLSSPQPSSTLGLQQNFTISREAKKQITYNNMQQEVEWFIQQNLFECIIKIIIICIVLIGIEEFIWNGGIKFIVILGLFVFFVFADRHCIFGSKIIQKWCTFSLILSTLTLINQLFLYILSILNPPLHQSLYSSYLSLIPSTYITILTIILLKSMSFLLPTQHNNSLLSLICNLHQHIFTLIKILYRLKWAILQVYALMFVLCVGIALFMVWADLFTRDQFQDGFMELIDIWVLVAEGVVFGVVVIFVRVVVQLGQVISYFMSSIYNKKDQVTKVPFMLQLLRLDQNSPHNQQYTQKPSIIQKILKLINQDPQLQQSGFNPLSDRQIHNIFLHSLSYIHNLVQCNFSALDTTLSYSKFYTNYYEVFEEFILKQLQTCSSLMFNLDAKSKQLEAAKKSSTNIWQDLAIWVRIFKKQIQIWELTVKVSRKLEILDRIMEILVVLDMDADTKERRWMRGAIGTNLRDIGNRVGSLKQIKELNPAIRQRMRQQCNKINRLTSIQ